MFPEIYGIALVGHGLFFYLSPGYDFHSAYHPAGIEGQVEVTPYLVRAHGRSANIGVVLAKDLAIESSVPAEIELLAEINDTVELRGDVQVAIGLQVLYTNEEY